MHILSENIKLFVCYMAMRCLNGKKSKDCAGDVGRQEGFEGFLFRCLVSGMGKKNERVARRLIKRKLKKKVTSKCMKKYKKGRNVECGGMSLWRNIG